MLEWKTNWQHLIPLGKSASILTPYAVFTEFVAVSGGT